MIKIGATFFEVCEELEQSKGISKEVIINSIKDAMVTAYKKHIKIKDATNVVAMLDEESCEIGVFRNKVVVENVEDPDTEISLEDAQELVDDVELEDEITIDVTPEDFGRIAAQSAKQVLTQRIREAERKMVLDEFMEKKGTLITGIIQRVEGRNVIVSIGSSEAVMPTKEQIPGEYYKAGTRIRVFVLNVKDTPKQLQVIVSHAHSEIVRELFELEVPEIEDGIIEIKSIAREAGFRTKIAVSSNDPEVDCVGACIGPRGSRIQTIIGELKNEKIDIVRYSENPVEYIVNTLAPARVVSVDTDEYSKEALVIVPDDQLSLAIGRGGQNVRLAHKLTGWKIDIKSVSQAETMERTQSYEDDESYEEPVDEEIEENAIMDEDDMQEEYAVDEEDMAEISGSEIQEESVEE